MTEILDFTGLEPVQIEVRISGHQYVLKEASGKAAGIYRNACMAAITIGPNGKATAMKNLADVEPLLVSLCLFDSNNKAVPITTISGWPSRIQKALFEKAKEISELSETTDEKKLLDEALELPGAPALREWVESLPEKFEPLKKLFKSEQDKAKNEQSDMTDG